jgi:TonB-dependent starch-binding outer membrane protein SusC
MRKLILGLRRLALPVAISCLPLQQLAASPGRAATNWLAVAAPVSGRILDENGNGLPGVNVVVKGTTVATQTDIDGRYTLEVPDGATLVFSYIGYATQEVAVAGQATVSISMQPDSKTLSDVVVVGYLTENRQNLSSAVSSADVKEAVKAPVATATQAIQGRVAGVQINSSGGPGDAPVVTIRGIGGLGNSGSNPLYVIDGLWTDNIRDLNPNDIETLTVLKDASSTAVYGSRGANGVVLITTKRGKSGTTAIGFNSYVGFDNIYKRYNLTNASDWADRAVQAYANAGLDPLNNGQNGLAGAVKGPGGAFNPNIDTDWQKEFFQSGKVENYNVNFSGGSNGDDRSNNFLVSADYFHQQGIVKGPDFERYSLRINSGFRRGKFRLQEQLQLTHLNVKLLNGVPFIDVLTMLPSIPVRDAANASGYGYGSPTLNTFATNPIGAQELLTRRQSDNRVAGNIMADYNIFDALTYRLNVALDGHTYANSDASRTGTIRQNTPNTVSSLSEFLGYDYFLMAENTLNFTKSFGNHSVNVIGGYSEQRYRQHNVSAQTQNFTTIPQYYFELSAGANTGVVTGGTYENARRSFFGQATYDYKNRYLLSASLRRDGSSRFTEENRWGNFGAGSIGWRVSEEDFFKNSISFINNLKLRASYGVVGNDQLPNQYLTSATIAQNVNYVIGTDQTIVNGSAQLALNSPDIKWEERETKDIGLDLGFLSNRLTFTADYYVAKTRDALAPVVLPVYLGNFGQALFQNLGQLTNKGLEVAIGYHEDRGSFIYGADFTLATLRNRVTALPSAGALVDGQGLTNTVVGQAVGAFFLIPYEGIFQTQAEVDNYKNAAGVVIQPYASPGDVKYRDSNGDGKIDNGDREFIGRSMPKLQFGLNLNAAYKNFDVSVFLQGVSGNDIFNNAKVALESYNGPNNYDADVQPWTAANPSSTTPRLLQGGGAGNLGIAASQNALFNTSRWLEDGSYLRVKNVQIGYTLPKSFTTKLTTQTSVRFYVTARNLVTFTKYTGFDPEITGTGFFGRGVDNGAYPNVRTFTGGVQVNF